MNIRHLYYFVTLAGEGHFGRASLKCNVTQPTLSGAITQLERELGVPLVDRKSQRFAGLTNEGKRVLGWAQRILADQKALEGEIGELRQGLRGELNLGIIPAAMPVAPLVTREFAKRHSGVTLRMLSLTSAQIQQRLDDGTIEAGMTYLNNEPLRNVRSRAIYDEHYLFLTPSGGPYDDRDSLLWTEAAQLPLCLLTRDMQNRRIIDRLFAQGGAPHVKVAIETDSVLALIAQVRSGGWSSVVPHTFLTLLGHESSPLTGLRAIPLTRPQARQRIGIVIADRDPQPPLTRALLKTIKVSHIASELRRLIPRSSG
jgi:DNA-binding transcriptional LysR family regulator